MQVRLLFAAAAVTISLGTQAQNTFPSTGSVGIGTTSPNTSSLLEVNSTTKGVLIPRMTGAQRTAISTPAQGLLVFQTDGTTGFYYYNSGWKVVTPATSGFANTKLSNLSTPTALNQTLLPNTTNARDLGSSTLAFRNLYLRGDVYLDGTRFVSNAPGTGQHNAFLGSNTGVSLTSGIDNTALGHYALNKTTTGYANTVSGAYALFTNTTGYSNTAVGTRALYLNTSGYKNMAVGDSALFNNTTGYGNAALGDFSMYNNTSGSYNTAVGSASLYANAGNFNTASGGFSLYNNSGGSYNTGIGYNALQVNTTQGGNTAIGFNAGNYAVAQNSTSLGHSSGATTPGLFNWTSIGYGSTPTASNQVMLGNTAVTSVWAAGPHVIYSDGRFKQNVQADVPGLEFINQLRPVTYHYKMQELNTHLQKETKAIAGRGAGPERQEDAATKAQEEESLKAKEQKLYTGFIAQDVETAAKKLNYDFSGVYKPQNDKDVYGLSYADFVVPLVKAVQQLDSANKAKDQKIIDLETRLSKLEALVSNSTGTVTSMSGSLEQNTPNPVTGTTTIRYHIPGTVTTANITITNAKGQLVQTLTLNNRGAGQVDFNSAVLASGTYNYTLWVDGKQADTKRFVIAR